MKSLSRLALIATGLASVAAPAAFGQPNLNLNLQPNFQPQIVNPPGLILNPGILGGCEDPAVVAFSLANVNRRVVGGRTLFDFRLTATVRNIGTQNWVSGNNQQSARITRIPAGGAPASIGSGNFPNLAAGAQIVVTSGLQTGWSTADEFPPSFEVRISYDPDIAIDGNPNNDDCNLNNNVMTLTGQQILMMLG